MKHTPGPWKYSTEPQPNGCPIIGAQGLMIAMLAHTVNQADQRETALANARLIAAAPDLLEFAQWVLSLKTGGMIEARARAVVTKAEGDNK
jgi:hypothetical protein